MVIDRQGKVVELAVGAAVVLRGDQSPVPAKDRVRGDDAGHLGQGPPAEGLAPPGQSTALGIGQVKRATAQVLSVPETRAA